MTKEEAAKRIQELLLEVESLANEHKVEFSFMGASMHYYSAYDSKRLQPATHGLLCSDDEWESSNCYGAVTEWEMRAFPEE